MGLPAGWNGVAAVDCKLVQLPSACSHEPCYSTLLRTLESNAVSQACLFTVITRIPSQLT